MATWLVRCRSDRFVGFSLALSIHSKRVDAVAAKELGARPPAQAWRDLHGRLHPACATNVWSPQHRAGEPGTTRYSTCTGLRRHLRRASSVKPGVGTDTSEAQCSEALRIVPQALHPPQSPACPLTALTRLDTCSHRKGPPAPVGTSAAQTHQEVFSWAPLSLPLMDLQNHFCARLHLKALSKLRKSCPGLPNKLAMPSQGPLLIPKAPLFHLLLMQFHLRCDASSRRRP